MCLIKSKGFVLFLVVMLSFTLIDSISTRKYDEINKNNKYSYVSMNIK